MLYVPSVRKRVAQMVLREMTHEELVTIESDKISNLLALQREYLHGIKDRKEAARARKHFSTQFDRIVEVKANMMQTMANELYVAIKSARTMRNEPLSGEKR